MAPPVWYSDFMVVQTGGPCNPRKGIMMSDRFDFWWIVTHAVVRPFLNHQLTPLSVSQAFVSVVLHPCRRAKAVLVFLDSHVAVLLNIETIRAKKSCVTWIVLP